MIGTVVNSIAVIAGGLVGLLLKKRMPERIKTIYFQAVGLFTLTIGISMAVKTEQMLIVVASLAIGSLIGEWLNIEQAADRMAMALKSGFRIGSDKFSEGFITSFLLFCVGSMTLLGCINEGTTGNTDLLYTKSLMDFFSSLLLASAFGVGVLFSSIAVFFFQGALTLMASFFGPFFSDAIILVITNVGGILLIGLGINILELKTLRIMNMLPSLLVVVILMYFSTLIIH